MDITTLHADRREARGARANERLRKTGKLPGVIYGHGEQPENVAVVTHDLAGLIKHGQQLVQLDLGGQTKPVLIKEVQFDHLAATPIHVDFMRVDLTEQVTVTVPLEFRGTPAGIQEGGVFDTMLADLSIRCLVTEIPDSIRVNVGDLHLGSMLHVRDLQLPANMTTDESPEAIVCAVRAKSTEEAIAPAAEGAELAEPEIITRREKTEEGEGETKEKK